MPRLTEVIGREPITLLSGPYGTEIADRVARDLQESPHLGAGVLHIEHLGAGCSALFSRRGRKYVRELSQDYIESVPEEQSLVLAVNSFRLPKQILESAAREEVITGGLSAQGLKYMRKAVGIANDAVDRSSRDRRNTLVAASIGPPFDCYRGEETPPTPEFAYAPQVFATIRFCNVDYLLFETIPSCNGAIGAAKAFTMAHGELDVAESTASFTNSGTIVYMGGTLENLREFGDMQSIVQSYDPSLNRFEGIEVPDKEYLLSLCLEKDAGLHDGRPEGGRTLALDEAIARFDEAVEEEGLHPPVGFGINCNSPQITRKALESASDEVRSRFVAIHPNASDMNDPRTYKNMKSTEAISDEYFAEMVKGIAEDFSLKIIGGCCGTHPGTMRALYEEIHR